jgi:hypothetical protein
MHPRSSMRGRHSRAPSSVPSSSETARPPTPCSPAQAMARDSSSKQVHVRAPVLVGAAAAGLVGQEPAVIQPRSSVLARPAATSRSPAALTICRSMPGNSARPPSHGSRVARSARNASFRTVQSSRRDPGSGARKGVIRNQPLACLFSDASVDGCLAKVDRTVRHQMFDGTSGFDAGPSRALPWRPTVRSQSAGTRRGEESELRPEPTLHRRCS